MDGELIKSFLVGLGFDVDDSSFQKFNKSIATATARVSALYASIEVTTGAIAFGITKISESFEDLGYEYKIIAPAINKALVLRQELLKAYQATGVNLVQVVQNALRLNISITKTKYAFEAIYKSVASRFFVLLTKQSDLFRRRLYEHLPQIQAALERFVSFVFKAFEIAATLGSRFWQVLTRVYDIFVNLDNATGGWSTKILAAVAAWKLLNLGFLATPLGALIGGFIVLLGLWDDLKTFREGGQALINWADDMTKAIVGMTFAVGNVILAYGLWAIATGAATGALAFLGGVLALVLSPLSLITIATASLLYLLDRLVKKIQEWRGVAATGFLAPLGGKILDFLGGPNIAQNLLNTPGGVPPVSPIGSSIQNSSSNSNQILNQQTQINVQSSADATSVGKAVSFEQFTVNRDLSRNMKGAATPGVGRPAQ